jgi:drug/metabolite transporter (DMT)-like permease
MPDQVRNGKREPDAFWANATPSIWGEASPMLWLILSLLTALAVASQDAWVKKHFSHLTADDMLAFPFLFSLPLFTLTIPFITVPPLDGTFYWCLLVSLPINFIPFFIYMKAIRVSPLSLTLPYLAFTPAFMIFTGDVFLEEIPNLWGLAGIVITCIGGYVLNLESGRHSFWAPIKAVFKETGSWLMLIVALIFSFSAVIGKKGILHSSPLFFTMTFFAVLSFVAVLVLLGLGKIRLRTFRDDWVKGMVAGILFFIHALSHGLAISMIKASYMISVKRLSALIGIIYGRLCFKEKYIALRFVGACLMVAGAVVITVWGR